jgi:hypothetical protein
VVETSEDGDDFHSSCRGSIKVTDFVFVQFVYHFLSSGSL